MTATWVPERTALYIAFMATSVFPNPTSQDMSRSIGMESSISRKISWIAID